MKKGLLLLATGLLIMSCQKDAVETLQGEVGALETTVESLQAQINELTATDQSLNSAITVLSDQANSIVEAVTTANYSISDQLSELVANISALESADADLAADIAIVSNDVANLDIPSIDGLATEDQLVDLGDAVASELSALEGLGDDLADLEAIVATLTDELTDVATDVAAIDPDVAVVSAWSPVFDDQDATFTQTNSTTLGGVFIEGGSRKIYVTSTATDTTQLIQDAYADVAAARLGEGDPTISQADYDANVKFRTVTTTVYGFKLAISDEDLVYTHEILTYSKLN